MTVGIVTRAAELLNTSQPVVSRFLKQLEDAKTNGKFDISLFRYYADCDSYTCFERHEMPLRRIKGDSRTKDNFANENTTGTCPIRKACPDG